MAETTMIDNNMMAAIIAIVAPIVSGFFVTRAKQAQTALKKSSDVLNVAKKYLFIANVITNQTSETIDIIKSSMADKTITAAEGVIIAKQLGAIVATLQAVATDEELKAQELIN